MSFSLSTPQPLIADNTVDFDLWSKEEAKAIDAKSNDPALPVIERLYYLHLITEYLRYKLAQRKAVIARGEQLIAEIEATKM